MQFFIFTNFGHKIILYFAKNFKNQFWTKILNFYKFKFRKKSNFSKIGVFKMQNRVISNEKVQKSVILDKNLTKN